MSVAADLEVSCYFTTSERYKGNGDIYYSFFLRSAGLGQEQLHPQFGKNGVDRHPREMLSADVGQVSQAKSDLPIAGLTSLPESSPWQATKVGPRKEVGALGSCLLTP